MKKTKRLMIPFECEMRQWLMVMLEIESETGLGKGSEVECEDGSIYGYDHDDAVRVMRGKWSVDDYLLVHKLFPWTFEEWAESYIEPRFNEFIARREALDDYRKRTGDHDVTTYGFVKRLREWAEERGVEFNPDDLCVPGTRRILKDSGDYLYFRTGGGAL